MRVNDVEGVVTLSKKRLDIVKNWDDDRGRRGGQDRHGGYRHRGEQGRRRRERQGRPRLRPRFSDRSAPRALPMSELVKQHVRLRITEVNRARRRVVGSIRAVRAERARRQAAEGLGRASRSASTTPAS